LSAIDSQPPPDSPPPQPSTSGAQAPRPSAGRRVPAWVAITGVITAVLLTGVITYVARGDARSTPGAPAAPVASAPGTPGGGLRVAAGAGGTAKAVDERTPIGYPSTCEGAVAAATNYSTAITEGLYQNRLTATEFSALLGQLNGGLDNGPGPMSDLATHFSKIRTESKAAHIPFADVQSHPEWGAFRVQNCSAGAMAKVDIAGWSKDGHAPGESVDYAWHISVLWSGNDWRLVSATDLENSPTMAIPIRFRAAPLPALQRKVMIASGGPGWTEYTNAPQN
jgi:hypothetical protein